MQRNVRRNDKNRGIVLPEDVSEDLAYLCGIFAGDGSINYRRKKNEYSLKVVGNPKDEKEFYHKIIIPKFERIFGISPRIKYHDCETTYGFSVYSKTIYTYLTKVIMLPSGIKYAELRVPEIFSKDKKFTIAFIRGVFDTDGCISFKRKYRSYPYYPTISLASKSPKFIKQIFDVLISLNLKPTVIYNRKVSDWRIKNQFTIISRIDLNGKDNLKKWIEKVGFSSPKHLNKIETFADWIN
ncbi:MAG: LAGLIDADG family homing endonuclease [Candidatus Woesearchaeota archaeon]